MRNLIIFYVCGAAVIAVGAAVILRRPAEPLTMGFVGYTNYSGVKAAIFTVTNHSIFEITFSGYAQRRSPTCWENVYPSEGPLARGNPEAGLIDLPGGQTVTFMTEILDGSWHGAVNYRWPETKWDHTRERLAYLLYRTGLPAGLTEPIYRQRAPVIQSRELQN